MTVASDYAGRVGFDIDHFVSELWRVRVSKWYVQFQNYSEYGLLDGWVQCCSEWRDRYSRAHYRNRHEASCVRCGIYAELCAGAILCPDGLRYWLPSVAVVCGGDNTGRDFRGEWSSRLSCDFEVKCIKGWHGWVPVDAPRMHRSGLVVVEQCGDALFRLLGVAGPKVIRRWVRRDPIPGLRIAWGFPREGLYQPK